MSIRNLKKYLSILKKKGVELIDMLENTPCDDEKFRDVVINFNNVFSNIQQYDMLIKELENEADSNVTTEE